MVDEGAAAATKDEGGVCRQPCGRGQQRWRQTRTATQWSATAAMAEPVAAVVTDEGSDSMECDGRLAAAAATTTNEVGRARR
uniref:DUF834 domain-containing protein n=1 Tax=Oryza rufipogon TaxID=4529 RepID=A0A0E0Q0K0_ORYRU